MKSEAQVQDEVRLEAAKSYRTHLWRNNVGAMIDAAKRLVRYGLANESAAMNDRMKSSDFIGITPVVITQEMVGQTIGVFTSIENKKQSWKWTGTDREKAQLTWIELIQEKGGIAGFATSGEMFVAIVKAWYADKSSKKN